MYHQNECSCGQHHGHREESGMNCGHGERRGHHGNQEESRMHPGGGCGCDCGCHQNGERHPGHGFGRFGQRRFISKEEMIARLEEYLKQLQAEVKGVSERITELKKEG